MNKLKEDRGMFTPHRIISTDQLMNTHSKAINELLIQISKSYGITIGDAAQATATVLEKISRSKR